MEGEKGAVRCRWIETMKEGSIVLEFATSNGLNKSEAGEGSEASVHTDYQFWGLIFFFFL